MCLKMKDRRCVIFGYIKKTGDISQLQWLVKVTNTTHTLHSPAVLGTLLEVAVEVLNH